MYHKAALVIFCVLINTFSNRQVWTNGIKINFCDYPCKLDNGTVLDANNYMCERSLRKSVGLSAECK